VNKKAIAATAAVTGTAAVLAAGYAAAGATGLIDVAVLATLSVLLAARGVLRSEKPRPVPSKMSKTPRDQKDFPAYSSIASDVEWARMSRRHYEHALRPRLSRLAAALGKPDATVSKGHDDDGPGPDLATLERIITHLESP
jgi:hypothetical protein